MKIVSWVVSLPWFYDVIVVELAFALLSASRDMRHDQVLKDYESQLFETAVII